MTVPYNRHATFLIAFLFLGFCGFGHAGNQSCFGQKSQNDLKELSVLSFNILYGGGQAKSVGFPNKDFDGSRIDEISDVIVQSKAQIVCIQEDSSSENLLLELRKTNSKWNRFDHVYSLWDITPKTKTDRAFGTTTCDITLPNKKKIAVINTHWYPSPYGPELLQRELRKGKPSDLANLSSKIKKASENNDGYRGYQQTIKAISEVPKTQPIILAGDFNEPSHLDWTKEFFENGIDRWRMNPTQTKLSIPIRWTGSELIHKTGLDDSFRVVHPNAVNRPGITFTPNYRPGTPGRKPINDQIHTRIDRIYYSRATLKPIVSKVLGEKSPWTDDVFTGKWPSDHRAVLSTFRLLPQETSTRPKYNQNELTFLPDQVYGHKAGMALTYDVIKPAKPNGAGIMYMVSGGWVSRWFPPKGLLRKKPRSLNLFEKMVSKGYTVFLVRHGSSPRFKVPEAVADSQKALRHISRHATRYDIDPNRIGVCGGSAGGHLSLMLGTTGRAGRKVAAVAAYFPPTDLTGIVENPGLKKQFPALDFPTEQASQVSPLFLADKKSAPTILIHGDQDRLVPIWHSEKISKRFSELSVPNKLIIIPGAAHGFLGKNEDKAESELLKWFDRFLRKS